MISTAAVVAALAYAGLANAQLPSTLPGCVVRCAATKISEGFCGVNSAQFTPAFTTCLNDNCNTADAATGEGVASQVCAAASSIVAGGSITGSATTVAVSSPPASAASASASSGASSAASSSSAASAAPSSTAASTATASGPAPSASGNATEYAAGAVAALNAAGLTTLATALERTAPADLLMALMQGQHTVFAPNNAAFEALGNATSNTSALLSTITYHVLQGYVAPDELAEGNHTLARSSLRGAPLVNLPGNQTQAIVLTSIGGNKTVIEPTRNVTSIGNATYQNLNIEVIPTVLTVPGTLATVAGGIPDLSDLVTAANAVSPQLITELSDVQGITIFAPVNSAFAAAQSALAGANSTVIGDVLLNHIVNGTAVYSSLIEPGANVTSAGGEPLSFISNSTGTFVTSGPATARIITTDVLISNGVVHTIDAILLNTASDPSAAVAAAASASSAGAKQTGTQTGAINPSATAESGGGGSGGGGGGSGGGSSSSSASAPSSSASNSFANGLVAPVTGVTSGFLGWLALTFLA